MTPEQQSLADAVAAELNLAPAQGDDGHWSRVFALPDGGRLYFSAGRQSGQLNISASVANELREHRPYYRAGEAPRTSINVSTAKDAQRIAADVRRRLLPEYEREAAACTANKAKHAVGESPKQVFRLLPRAAVKPASKGEDPKAFLRRLAERARMADANPGEAAGE